MKTLNECSTLHEYREHVLGMPQKKVGVRAGYSPASAQARISAIESGKVPRRWNWKRFLEAYQLSANQFERLIKSQQAAKALQTLPPLMFMQLTDAEKKVVESVALEVAARIQREKLA
jgi:hypothetical protein